MKKLKFSLYCGAIYFFLMAIAHALGVKIPGLFIYFNVPSYVYQDKIISALAFGWAVSLFTAAQNLQRDLVKASIISGGAALSMLAYINVSTDFVSLSTSANPLWFHLEVAALFVYWIWLLLCYFWMITGKKTEGGGH